MLLPQNFGPKDGVAAQLHYSWLFLARVYIFYLSPAVSSRLHLLGSNHVTKGDSATAAHVNLAAVIIAVQWLAQPRAAWAAQTTMMWRVYSHRDRSIRAQPPCCWLSHNTPHPFLLVVLSPTDIQVCEAYFNPCRVPLWRVTRSIGLTCLGIKSFDELSGCSREDSRVWASGATIRPLCLRMKDSFGRPHHPNTSLECLIASLKWLWSKIQEAIPPKREFRWNRI